MPVFSAKAALETKDNSSAGAHSELNEGGLEELTFGQGFLTSSTPSNANNDEKENRNKKGSNEEAKDDSTTTTKNGSNEEEDPNSKEDVDRQKPKGERRGRFAKVKKLTTKWIKPK